MKEIYLFVEEENGYENGRNQKKELFLEILENQLFDAKTEKTVCWTVFFYRR